MPQEKKVSGHGETGLGEEVDLRQFLLERGVEIAHERKGGLIECYIPADLIDYEEVPVDEELAKSLAHQMHDLAQSHHEGSGQQTPIGLRLIEGEEKLKISDGFHRDAALRINGEVVIYATVKKDDWDGLYDQRIFDSKNHPNLRFSRVVQWMRDIWDISGLGQEGLSLDQAILLYRFENQTGERLGITPEQADFARQWIEKKKEAWGIAAMTIHGHLKIAENVDPKLVHSTREKNRGDRLDAPTQSILKVFSERLPNNFEFQNLVMQAAIEHNLGAPKVAAVCQRIEGCETSEEAYYTIAQTDWDNLKPLFKSSTERSLRRAHDVRFQGALALKKSEEEIDRVLRRAELIEQRGEEVNEEMKRKVAEAWERAVELMTSLGQLANRLGGLAFDGSVEVTDEVDGDDEQQAEASASDGASTGSKVASGSPKTGGARTQPRQETAGGMKGLEDDIWDRQRREREAAEAAQVSVDDENTAALIEYLAGRAKLPIADFSKRQMLDAWRAVDGMKPKPPGWQERFRDLQPHIAEARRSGMAEKRLGK